MILFMIDQSYYPRDEILESEKWKKMVYLGGEAEWPGGKGAAFGGIRRESQQYDLAGRSQVTLPILSPSFLGQQSIPWPPSRGCCVKTK